MRAVDQCEALRRTALCRALDAEALHVLAEHAIERRLRKTRCCVSPEQRHAHCTSLWQGRCARCARMWKAVSRSFKRLV
jgi:hypothetical protein